MFSTPEPFNFLLWRVVAKVGNDSYIETVRSVFDQGPSESLRRPLNTVLADALPDSSRLAGLRWFTDNWLRYDSIDNRLVVTDLRMGLGGGFYSFRFEMARRDGPGSDRSEEHTSELQSLMRISYAVFCLKKKTN